MLIKSGFIRRGRLTTPDPSTMEPLRQFFVRRIWTVGRDWNPYVERVQLNRNAIHAFRARKIGTFGVKSTLDLPVCLK